MSAFEIRYLAKFLKAQNGKLCFWTRKLYTIIKYFGLGKVCYHVGRFLSLLVTDGEPSTTVIKIVKNKTYQHTQLNLHLIQTKSTSEI